MAQKAADVSMIPAVRYFALSIWRPEQRLPPPG
jgi:hypothetical protein